MPNIGPLELGIVLIVALLILGPKKLPEMGRSVGHGMREFRDSITGRESGDRAVEAAGDEASEAADASSTRSTDS